MKTKKQLFKDVYAKYFGIPTKKEINEFYKLNKDNDIIYISYAHLCESLLDYRSKVIDKK